MEQKVKSSLSITGVILFLLGYSIYLIYKNFNIEQLFNLRESIIEYKYRIFLVVFIHLLIILGKELPFKKPKLLELFFLWRKPIITIIMFIYPFLSDFQQRFGGQIYENNVTDFYVIILPIFIMFIITSLLQTGDSVFLKEMKDILSIKPNTDHKINSLIIKSSKSTIISFYIFLFLLLAGWICRTNKVNPEYEKFFKVYPLAFFCLSLGISLSLEMILNNKPNIKSSAKSNIKNSHKIKNNIKKDSPENIKVNFK